MSDIFDSDTYKNSTPFAEPPVNLSSSFRPINFDFTSKNLFREDEMKVDNVDCNYYDTLKFNSQSFSHNSLSFFHLNISSLSRHIDDLEIFLNSLNMQFKILAITETRISSSSVNFSLPGYQTFLTPTDAAAGGSLLFVSNSLDSFSRQDLDKFMYSSKLLESTFAEISIKNQPNVIVGSIYKHPSMPISDFNYKHLGPLLDQISREGKLLILLGDFNINLLRYNDELPIQQFLDTLSSYLLLPQINLPTRISTNSETLIDNIFISATSHKCISGNLLTGISDHLPQFLILDISNRNNTSPTPFFKDWKHFDKDKFSLLFNTINWNQYLRFDENNPDISFDLFYEKLNNLVSKCVPTRKLSKNQRKKNNKPWITKGIKKSIWMRDKYFKRFMNCKSKINKTEFHRKYKIYRNKISNLIKISRNNHFKNFFNVNLKNSKKFGVELMS